TRCHLIHDPDWRTDELHLRTLRRASKRHVGKLELKRRADRAQRRHLERCARRESASDRNVRLEVQLEPADPKTFAGEDPGHALDVVPPRLCLTLAAQLVLERRAFHLAAARDDAGVVTPPEYGAGPLRDGARHHESIVIV